MCTYLTEKLDVEGSGKGAAGWFALTEATVYFDHPVHAPAEHTLNIDFLNPAQGPSARVAVELTASRPARWPRRSVGAGRRAAGPGLSPAARRRCGSPAAGPAGPAKCRWAVPGSVLRRRAVA